MREFILGLSLFSSFAFANPNTLLSNELSPGDRLEIQADLQLGSGIFYVVDTGNSWRRNNKPEADQTYCALFSNTEGPRVARAKEIYRITSVNPIAISGGVGTKIELVNYDSNLPSALSSIVCSHAHIEFSGTAPKIRNVLRYELFSDEFAKLLNGYLIVRP